MTINGQSSALTEWSRTSNQAQRTHPDPVRAQECCPDRKVMDKSSSFIILSILDSTVDLIFIIRTFYNFSLSCFYSPPQHMNSTTITQLVDLNTPPQYVNSNTHPRHVHSNTQSQHAYSTTPPQHVNSTSPPQHVHTTSLPRHVDSITPSQHV